MLRSVLFLVTSLIFLQSNTDAQSPFDRTPANRVTMDVFVRYDSERCQQLCDFLEQLQKRRPCLDVVVHDVAKDITARRNALELGRTFKIQKMGLPAIHVMDRFHVGYSETLDGQRRVASLLTVEVFVRSGCNRCRDAKLFLNDLALRWPAVHFDIRDIVTDTAAKDRLAKLVSHHRIQASSVPAFYLCGKLKIGYLGPTITGAEIESMIRKAARSRPRKTEAHTRYHGTVKPRRDDTSTRLRIPLVPFLPRLWSASSFALLQTSEMDSLDELPELESGEFEEIDVLPAGPEDDATLHGTAEQDTVGEMEVPFLGRLNAKRLGMPVFTFLVGLVDGFNPCAMWVLMFLLSVLVNIKERKKILVIAGTFVFVSGLAYYAFMAAWLNVFMLVGLDRPAQLILGSVAIGIGVINVKDFFAFGKGVSLKIPEAAKPGLYSRVRKIVAAKHLLVALSGAIVLAVLVNVIELLCTAGLPAMYTQILTMQEYSPAVNYLYLGLYILAYMLDDSIMVGIVVVTLSKKKLQEGQGRWLKLISGLVILALGLVMIVKPDLLV